MSIQTRLIEYRHDDITLEGLLAWDDGIPGARPGVAIAHAWRGRSGFDDGKAIRLAELGYTGFALDMFGKGIQGSSVEENQQLIAPFMEDRALLQERINLGIDILDRQPEVDSSNIGAIGFCFGGLCVLDLARTGRDLKGVVSFHGLFIPAGNTSGNKIRAKVLCLHGYDDPMVPPEQVMDLASELTEAGADWQIHAYGHTRHAFTNPVANDPDFGTVYDKTADERSWIAMKNFFAEIFG